MEYHIHSDFSADGERTLEEKVKMASEEGRTEIYSTEEVDYDYPDPTIDFSLDNTSYHEKIKEMQAKYTGLIQVKKGVEIGVEPHLLSRYEKLIQEETFDFIICSEHTTNRQDLHGGALF